MIERLDNGMTLRHGAFPLGTDTMLLAQFAALPARARVADLGAGSGTLGVLLCKNAPDCAVTGVELDAAAHVLALENIRELNETGGEHELINYKKKDGATKLTRVLMEESTEVHFLVGQALNEAHQNPGMPVSLGLKFSLIGELAEELRKTGKRVTIEYF